MIIESVLCALTAALLITAAVRMYMEGSAVQASGDLFYHIYTREKAGAALASILPLITFTAAFTAAGWILGIRDEKAGKPAVLKEVDTRKSLENAAPPEAGRAVFTLRIIILIIAVVMIILGIHNGGLDEVFAKGASICTECVGLG